MPTKRLKKFKHHFRWINLRHLHHPLVIPVVAFLVLFFASIALFIGFNGQTLGAGDSRIVELTISGKQQIIPTTASTVGQLLNRLNIKLNSGDVVEPGLNAQILQNDFQINIYRAHPVTVIEADQKSVIQTASSDPRTIASQAGYTVYPEDAVTVNANATNISQDVLGEEVVIDPSVPVNLDLYGNQVTLRTLAKTVGQLLSDKKIAINPESNNVVPTIDTPISANMQILVVPVGQKLISTQQVIPFATQTVLDPSIPYGTVTVQQAGSNGLALDVQDVTVKNGATTTTTLQQVIITPAVNEIIDRGTGVVAVAGGNNIDWLKSSNINPAYYQDANYIMNIESHWNPDDISYSGCIGLGQSCPSSSGVTGLAVVCPDWQSDAVCQLDFFNSYADSHWGSWAAAYQHEATYGWW